MQLWKGYGIKLIGVLIVTLSVFSIFYETTLLNLLMIGFIIASLSYLGDIFLLPKLNKMLAAALDFVAYFTLFWLFASFTITDGWTSVLPAFLAAYLATAAEAVFHIYMTEQVVEDKEKPIMIKQYQTEIAEEKNVETKENKQEPD